MRFVFAIAALFFVLPTLAEAPKKIPPQTQSFIEQFEAEQGKLQGGAIAILHKDKVIYKKAFGYQKAKLEPIKSSTLFPLASVSKPVAAVAIALLVDKGALNFDEKYKLAYLKNEVSLSHILSHTTGYPFSGNYQIEQGMSRKALLAKLQEQTPACKPGNCYTYSNTTYSLVEDALKTKNLSFAAAIRELQSALKTNAIQIVPIPSTMQVAYPHSKETVNKKEVVKALPFPPYYPKAVPAAAGVFASLDGMIEFYKLSFGYRPDLISQKTLDALYSPIIANRDIEKWSIKWPINRNEIDSTYGLGWRILKAKQSPKENLIFHAGMIAGAVSFIGFIPEEEMGIVILVNQRSRVPLENGIGFWGEFLKQESV